jgi:hypothetical protein
VDSSLWLGRELSRCCHISISEPQTVDLVVAFPR